MIWSYIPPSSTSDRPGWWAKVTCLLTYGAFLLEGSGRFSMQTNTVPARYFWTKAKASFIEENVTRKFDVLVWTS